MSRIWLAKPASDWNEALPVGNGTLGAMVFGGVEREHLQLNEDSVWTGNHASRVNPSAKEVLPEVRRLLFEGKGQEAEALAEAGMLATQPYMSHYEPLGDLWLDFGDPAAPRQMVHLPNGIAFAAPARQKYDEYRRDLDLSTGMASVSYRTSEERMFRECFASFPSRVLVYRVAGTAGDLSCRLTLSRRDPQPGRSCAECDGIEALDSHTLRLFGKTDGEAGVSYELAVRVVAEGGSVRTLGATVIVEHAQAVTVLVAARTSFRSSDPLAWCVATLDAASSKPYAELKSEAQADYAALHDSFALELASDPALEALPTDERLRRVRGGATDPGLVSTYVDYGRYLLISSSREGSLPANLQGIWNAEFHPMWGSKYTVNINTEMNYWLAERAGLSSLHLPLFDHMERMRPRGEQVAQDMYGARGWVCHHNTDIWGDCAPQDANTTASIWPMGGAWLCTHIAEHWRHTHDMTFARRCYPLVRGAVEFFFDYLVQDTEGRWITGPSTSPENCYVSGEGCVSLCMGPAMDTEILHELLADFVELSEALEEDVEMRERAAGLMAGLPSLQVGRHGQVVEWLHDYDEADPGHRHVSQLWALFPGTQIRADKTPELAAAAETTLRRRLSQGGGHTGWSKAWIILLFARLGCADDAWEHLQGLLANATLPNLLDNHPPFQIDGNFGGATSVLEMLARDYSSELWLLPALPEQLGEGSVRGLHVSAGATLDLAWEAGCLTSAVLNPERAGQLTVHLPGGESIAVQMVAGEAVQLV